ncbi:MAG: hypothetical protein O2875_04030 [Planctomycetota bacterium]|nr:hypothetical protein [Planctomycetota bacterium]MDA1261515.1 hypothetical protein [Planctomycetota bacterium]
MSQDAHMTSPVQEDDPEAGSTWVVSLASIIILSALVIATCVFYFKFEDKEVDMKVIIPPNLWKTQLKNEQLAQLDIYQKYSVTAPDGSAEPRIRIPVTKAMELVIADSKNPPKVVVAPVVVPAPASAPTASTGSAQK